MTADQPQVGVESGTQFLDEGSQATDLILGQKLPVMGTPQPMSRLIQRSSRDLHETAIVLERPPARSLGEIGANPVRATDDLLSERVPSKTVPRPNYIPDLIRQPLRKPIDRKIHKVFRHQVPSSDHHYPASDK